jgi:hypothetical protein
MTTKQKLYLAGPMRGIALFNYPAFEKAAATLRADGYYVFNPAEADIVRTGKDAGDLSPSGDLAEAQAKGFDLRAALCEDLTFVCKEADGIALLPGWEKSKGATAEHATAVALGLNVIYLFEDDGKFYYV